MARRDPTQDTPILEQMLGEARREQDELIREFVHQHARALEVLAARLVGRADAEDVAQDAFVNLVKWVQTTPVDEAMACLRSEDGLLKLMCKMTWCRAYDHLRRRKDELAGDGEQLERTVEDRSGVCSQVALDVKRVERAYRRLPPAQRIAHVLHHYYGFTDADLEATLGITKANARTLVCRANLALKAAMEITQ
jgi:DNA-directed RNA polymerase specialized sigma24 family protein